MARILRPPSSSSYCSGYRVLVHTSGQQIMVWRRVGQLIIEPAIQQGLMLVGGAGGRGASSTCGGGIDKSEGDGSLVATAVSVCWRP